MEKIIQQPIKSISRKLLSTTFLIFLGSLIYAQTTLSGKIVDEDNYPIANAQINANEKTVQSDEKGEYKLNIPETNELNITISAEGKLPYKETRSNPKRQETLYVRLLPESTETVELPTVIFQSQESEEIGSIAITPKDVNYQPSLTGSFTDIIKTLPYASVNNELSSQYMVRGGNFDENLVYVNGIEIYRPQLVRAGQQEGLSFLNPSMAASVSFNAGGWESKYGDKMSSVLDVVYRRPTEFEGTAELSLMGGNLTIGGTSKNKKLSALVGARYLNRNLILNTLDGDTEFNPQSYDIQANLNYEINPKWEVSFLGNFSRTLFEQKPNDRTTSFGTLDRPITLTVFYDGKEEDLFQTEMGAFSVLHKPTKKLNLGLDVYAYHSVEEEYFDIQGAYLIREGSEDTEGSLTTLDAAGQIDHARNDLDILVTGVQHRGKYDLNNNSDVEWGVTYQQEDIRDLLNEWQLIDSAGYNITPNNPGGYYGPGQSDLGDLVLNYSINGKNKLTSNRFSAYTQYTKKFFWNNTKILFNAGVRATYWDFNEELNISPRAQIAIKPNWEKDMLFRFSTGLYYQPPFYKEMRTVTGELNPDIKSQRSIHFIFGHDYEFLMMNRPFKLSSEIYYKNMDDLIPYYLNNVQVKYTAENNSKGRSYGIDTRLIGEFVPGIESWLSLSYARSEENIDGQGWIPRPTDPRFKASLFFQDYMPSLPSFKVNVTLIYASGLPNGAPLFTDPYDFQTTLPDYKRVDIGLTKVLVNQSDMKARSGSFWSNLKELSVGLDVFNVFDIQNTVSKQWIRDVNSNAIYGVPNRLTGRFFNAKLYLKF